MKRRRLLFHAEMLAIALLLLFLAANAVAAPRATVLDWRFIGSGGRRMSSAGFTLYTAVGQPVGGVMSSGNFQLRLGYWYGVGDAWGRFYLPLNLKGLRV